MKVNKKYQSVYALYGASGAAAGIVPFAKKFCKNSTFFLIDDDPNKSSFLGTPVLRFEEFLELNAKKKFVAITIASPKIRKKISNKLKKNKINDWSIAHESLIKMKNVNIKDGYIISPYVTITSNIKIGSYFHANLYSYIEHDCQIGNFVTFAPGVKCNGNVIIEDNVYVGSGVIIINGKINKPLKIGEGSILGAGAVVTNSIPANCTVVGNPARIIKNEKKNLA